MSEKLLRRISTPSGLCPIRLHGCDEIVVREWIEKVVASGMSAGITYDSSALRYWAAQMIERSSPEYPIVCGHISKIVGDSVPPKAIPRRSVRPRIDPEEMYDELKRNSGFREETGVLRPPTKKERPVKAKPQTIGELAKHLLKGK
jgi:hypothetical protein